MSNAPPGQQRARVATVMPVGIAEHRDPRGGEWFRSTAIGISAHLNMDSGELWHANDCRERSRSALPPEASAASHDDYGTRRIVIARRRSIQIRHRQIEDRARERAEQVGPGAATKLIAAGEIAGLRERFGRGLRTLEPEEQPAQ